MSPVPPLELLTNYYHNEFGSWESSEQIEEHYQKAATSKIYSLVFKYIPTSEIGIDFGCGYGGLVQALNNIGYSNFIGTDVGKSCIEVGQKRGNKNIYLAGNQPEIFNSNLNFITCSHVIEHVPDLAVFINTIKNLLTENGYLFLALPNGGHLPAFLGDFSRFDWFQFPMHLNYFTPESLIRFFHNNGFEIIDLQSQGSSSQNAWTASNVGLPSDQAETLCNNALVNRELIAVFKKTSIDPKQAEATDSEQKSRDQKKPVFLEDGFGGDEGWTFGSCPCNPLDLSKIQPMTLCKEKQPTYKGTEKYCIIATRFIHPGRQEAAVAVHNIQQTGVYIVNCEARLLDPRSIGTLFIFFINGNPIAHKLVGTDRSRLQIPFKSCAGDHLMVIAAPPSGNNSYSTTEFRLSVQLVFNLKPT